jgi:hypothetical protein
MAGSDTHLGRQVAELAARLWRDIYPKHASKLLSRALGVSHATARQYVEQPYLVPPSRAEQLLLALERAHAEQEQKTIARRKVLETLRGQLKHEFHRSSGDQVRQYGNERGLLGSR